MLISWKEFIYEESVCRSVPVDGVAGAGGSETTANQSQTAQGWYQSRTQRMIEQTPAYGPIIREYSTRTSSPAAVVSAGRGLIMTNTNPSQKSMVECQHCNERITAKKTRSGRIILTPSGATGGGSAGWLLGSTNGVVGSITATRATSVFGPAGAIIGGLAGYIIGEYLDYHQCPSCGEKLNI